MRRSDPMTSFKLEIGWNYKSLYDFQFFNCPTCVFKDHSKQEFVNHVFENHPEVSNNLKNISDDSIKNVIFPCNSDQETLDKSEKIQIDINSKKEGYVPKKFNKERKKKPATSEGFCPICKENIGEGEKNLKIHLETFHKKLTKIPPTRRKLYLKKKLFDPNDENCPICHENISQQISVLQKHVKETHQRILCSMCQRHFAKNLTLKRHVNAIHQKARPFECPICEYKSSTKQVLQRHILKIHPKEFDFDLKSQKESMEVMAKISEVFVSKEQPKKEKIMDKQVKVDEPGEIVTHK